MQESDSTVVQALVAGVVLGVVSSLFAWWLIARAAAPRFALSDKVSKLPSEGGQGYRYRVKLVKTNRRWRPRAPLVDVTVAASVHARGLRPGFPMNWVTIELPIERPSVPALELSLLAEIEVNRFRVHATGVPEDVTEAARAGRLQLERLLGLGDVAVLRVVAGASDGYTHARRSIVKEYRADAIRAGRFRGRRSLDLVEMEEP